MEKTQIKQIRKEMDEALESVAKKHNLKMQIHTITFSKTGFKTKITGDEINSAGENTTALKHWELAVSDGIVRQEWLGKVIRLGNEQFEITGYDLNKRKNNILMEQVRTGKSYVTDVLTVERNINKEQ